MTKASGPKISPYYDSQFMEGQKKAGLHRDTVGGLWDEIGRLQFDFLVSRGLKPGARLLDVGCGSFRGGVHFIRYLDQGNYYGMDVNKSLIEAGYDMELKPARLDAKVPPENLLVDSEFNCSRFGVTFDMALALSVFTHLPLNHIRLCLAMLGGSVRSGGSFFATYFRCPEGHAVNGAVEHEPGGIVTYPDRDPYHYYDDDFDWLARRTGWGLSVIGEFGHPRAQRMLQFIRK